MTSLGSLRRALQAVEAAIPSFAVRLLQASPEARTAWQDYRTDCAAWAATRPGALAYAAFLQGEAPPSVPAILMGIMPAAPTICVGDDAGAIWRAMLERK